MAGDRSEWWYLRLYVAGRVAEVAARVRQSEAAVRGPSRRPLRDRDHRSRSSIRHWPAATTSSPSRRSCDGCPLPLRKVIGDLSEHRRRPRRSPARAGIDCDERSRTTRRSSASRTSWHEADEAGYELTLFVSGASELAALVRLPTPDGCATPTSRPDVTSPSSTCTRIPRRSSTSRVLATPTLVRNAATACAPGRRRPVDSRQGAPGAGPPHPTMPTPDRLGDHMIDYSDALAANRRWNRIRIGPSGPTRSSPIVDVRRCRRHDTDDVVRCARSGWPRPRTRFAAIAAGEVDAFVVSDGGSRPSCVHAVDS